MCNNTINQSTWQGGTEQSNHPPLQAAAQQSINLSGRLQQNYRSVPPSTLPHDNLSTYLAGYHTTINQSTWQAATQLLINPTN
jgi:hypothetical protein